MLPQQGWVHFTFAVLSLNPAPLRPKWEKGFGDEGKFAKLGCTRWGYFQ